MLREETVYDFFERIARKSEKLKEIKKKNYINQLESMPKREYNLFMEAIAEYQKEQKS